MFPHRIKSHILLHSPVPRLEESSLVICEGTNPSSQLRWGCPSSLPTEDLHQGGALPNSP